MRFGSVEIHALLLVGALALAYYAPKAGSTPAGSSSELPIWDLGASPIDRVTYTTEKRTLVVERKADASGSYLWGVTKRAADKGPAITREFRLNSKGDDVLAGLTQALAKRKLGALSAEELKEMKLSPPEAVIAVTVGEKTRTLEVGMGAYGGGLRYVREAQSGDVFVMEAKALDDLRWGDSRLVERNIFPFKLDAVANVELSAQGQQRQWAVADSGNDAEATWLGKLFRLRVTQYIGSAEDIHTVDGKTLEETDVLELLLTTADGAKGSLTMTRVGDEKKARYFLQSSHTKSRVSVSRTLADEVERDLEGVLSTPSATPKVVP